MTPVRHLVVALLVAGWLGPLVLAAARPDPCCCPAAMHGACAKASAGSCSVKRCTPDDGGVLAAAKVVLTTAVALPAPEESGPGFLASIARLPGRVSDPFEPPPRT